MVCDNGYVAEAAPTIRSMIEHAIALWWVVDQRGDAFQVLVRVRARAAATLQKAQAIGSNIAGEDAQRLLQEVIDEETDSETVTFDYLKATAAQAEKYGLGALYQAWLLETGQSHARIDSARPYYVHRAGTTIDLLRVPVDTGSEPEAAVTNVIYTALLAYNRLLDGAPLNERLEAWAGEFSALSERLRQEIQSQLQLRPSAEPNSTSS